MGLYVLMAQGVETSVVSAWRISAEEVIRAQLVYVLLIGVQSTGVP